MRFISASKSAGKLLLCILCALFSVVLLFSPVFAGGSGYELYQEPSSSSPCVRTDTPFLDKLLLRPRGESARFEGDKREELVRAFRARLLFEEEACGVKNYYLYSPFLGKGVELNGACVNLHIAVSEDMTAAGTPLIFGGF